MLIISTTVDIIYIDVDVNHMQHLKKFGDINDIAIFRYGYTSCYDMLFFDVKTPHHIILLLKKCKTSF